MVNILDWNVVEWLVERVLLVLRQGLLTEGSSLLMSHKVVF
jgi:hypothetical protein